LINDLATRHGQENLGLADFRGLDPKKILCENNKVGKFARFERTLRSFAVPRERRSHGVSTDSVFQADAFFRNESSRGISLRGLAGQRILPVTAAF